MSAMPSKSKVDRQSVCTLKIVQMSVQVDGSACPNARAPYVDILIVEPAVDHDLHFGYVWGLL